MSEISEELLKKVKRIAISTRKILKSHVSGGFRSHFKGQGMQFSEHRNYMHGDDVRHMDWKVSARQREMVVKKYEEERELTVFLVIDISGSQIYGSGSKTKAEVQAELACLIATAAMQSGDRVGALLFSGGIEKIIPPKKSKQHVLRMVRDILAATPTKPGTEIKSAVEATLKIMKHSGVVFVLSDFLDQGYDITLKRLARRHDVVGICLQDTNETVNTQKLTQMGRIVLFDPESGEESFVDTGSYLFKKWFTEKMTSYQKEIEQLKKGGRLELIEVTGKEDYLEKLIRFFQSRSKRKK